MNRQEALEEARKLVSQGWKLIPCDDPLKGLQGFCAFRHTLRGRPVAYEDLPSIEEETEEETRILQWPLFNGPMTPDIQDVEAEDLLAFAQEDPDNLFYCGDPKRLRLGFVRYDRDNGIAHVRQTRLVQVKRSSRSRELVDFWNNLVKADKAAFDERFQEARDIERSPA